MPKVLQINVTANWGSHGKIAELIGQKAISHGWESYIAYGRNMNPSKSHLIKIGTKLDFYLHVLCTRLFGGHGLYSTAATRKLIKKIDEICPNVVHIHNIHGYYLNYKVLFEYLAAKQYTVIITMHDCWTFTGHCAHFAGKNCSKWKTCCCNCPSIKSYPSSIIDFPKRNFELKHRLYSTINNLTMVPVSNWIADFLPNSILKGAKVRTIHNGVDVDTFMPKKDADTIKDKYNIPKDKFMILGVANIWVAHRGLNEFYKVQKQLSDDFVTVLVGMSEVQIKQLPQGFVGIKRTDSVSELASLYSAADVYMNPTWSDTFPTTNLEALACGTPVITFRTGGSPEAVDEKTGIVVKQGDVKGLITAVLNMKYTPLSSNDCRKRAEELFDKDKCFEKYVELYEELLNGK